MGNAPSESNMGNNLRCCKCNTVLSPCASFDDYHKINIHGRIVYVYNKGEYYRPVGETNAYECSNCFNKPIRDSERIQREEEERRREEERKRLETENRRVEERRREEERKKEEEQKREEEKIKIHGSIKTELLELLFKTIDDLEVRDLNRFKAFLSEEHLRGYAPIPKARLETADATEIINLMSQTYDRNGAVQITAFVLKKMCRMDLVNEIKRKAGEKLDLTFLDG